MSNEMLIANKQKIKGDKDEFFVDLHLTLEDFNKLIEWGEYTTSTTGMNDKDIDLLQELTSLQADIKKYMKK